MIKVDINMVPGGVGEPVLKHRIRIWNDATGSKTKGNYLYQITTNDRVVGYGRITDFPRKSHTATRLLWECLKDHFGELYPDE